jgi:hypothetical protein
MKDKYNLFLENIYTNLNESKQEEGIDLKDFIAKRAMGAKKIQKQAEEKGGAAMLTSVHFKAKEVPYEFCEKNMEDLEKISKKADEVFQKLKGWKNMSQRDFQHYMGMLEAYGEIVIRIKKLHSFLIIH